MDRRRVFQWTAGVLSNTLAARFAESAEKRSLLPALLPRDQSGNHFVLYSDCCSGISGTVVARNLQAVNAMVARIEPQPEFVAFPGDAVVGYTKDYAELRRQWDYWFKTEMQWIRERRLPLMQSTSKHNTYDVSSEAVFRDVHLDLPQNGPSGQKGLAYWFRRENLLYVSTLQPDRRMVIDHAWLDQVLTKNSDADFKFVV